MPVCSFDTNVLAYAAGIGQSSADVDKARIADALIADALRSAIVVHPVQVCLELHNLLVRKGGLTPGNAAELIREFTDGMELIATDDTVLEAAFVLASQHRLQTYDSVILAAAAQAGCNILYSEDMQHGFEWRGVMIINPFA